VAVLLDKFFQVSLAHSLTHIGFQFSSPSHSQWADAAHAITRDGERLYPIPALLPLLSSLYISLSYTHIHTHSHSMSIHLPNSCTASPLPSHSTHLSCLILFLTVAHTPLVCVHHQASARIHDEIASKERDQEVNSLSHIEIPYKDIEPEASHSL
jgi:hypothetical protein